MKTVFAMNGSPSKEKGCTALLLAPFMEGMQEAGARVELFYASRLRIKPCSCNEMHCWNDTPAQCCIQDDMQDLYPRMKSADILVLAMPVYIPFPGDMQNFINRLVPLMDPELELRAGRTRIRLYKDVNIRQVVLVGVSGWWELENFGRTMSIIQDLCATMNVEFAGALLRPHVNAMKSQGKITHAGKMVLQGAHRAGLELIHNGAISPEAIEIIRRPLVPVNEY